MLRQTTPEGRWPGIEKYIKVAFWGTNIGLMMMLGLSLFSAGVLQLRDVIENGYWHARSLAYIGNPRSLLVEWLRLPGDAVFIVFGAVPLLIAAIKGWLGGRLASAGQRTSGQQKRRLRSGIQFANEIEFANGRNFEGTP